MVVILYLSALFRKDVQSRNPVVEAWVSRSEEKAQILDQTDHLQYGEIGLCPQRCPVAEWIGSEERYVDRVIRGKCLAWGQGGRGLWSRESLGTPACVVGLTQISGNLIFKMAWILQGTEIKSFHI